MENPFETNSLTYSKLSVHFYVHGQQNTYLSDFLGPAFRNDEVREMRDRPIQVSHIKLALCKLIAQDQTQSETGVCSSVEHKKNCEIFG